MYYWEEVSSGVTMYNTAAVNPSIQVSNYVLDFANDPPAIESK